MTCDHLILSSSVGWREGGAKATGEEPCCHFAAVSTLGFDVGCAAMKEELNRSLLPYGLHPHASPMLECMDAKNVFMILTLKAD